MYPLALCRQGYFYILCTKEDKMVGIFLILKEWVRLLMNPGDFKAPTLIFKFYCYCLCHYSFSFFSFSSPPPSPSLSPAQANAPVIVRVHGLCIHVLWLIPSPSLILSPTSFLAASRQSVLCI